MSANRFTVRGSLPFPIDMLRYDACFPDRETDSGIITRTINSRNDGAVEVGLIMASLGGQKNRRPQRERWMSFGWEVLQ